MTVRRFDSMRDPVVVLAAGGGIVAALATGAMASLAWIVVGVMLGAALGKLLRRRARGARSLVGAISLQTTASKRELYREARKLGIEGRSTMDREQLIQALVDKQASLGLR
jgi:hypothetical protein